MKITTLALMTLCFCHTCISAGAENKVERSPKTGKIFFHGVIENYTKGDRFRVIYNEELYQGGPAKHEVMNFFVEPDVKGKIEFSLPYWGYTARLVLQFKKLGYPAAQISGRFLVNKGDDISFRINKLDSDRVDVLFKGKGSLKYECASKMMDDLPDLVSEASNHLFTDSLKEYTGFLDSLSNSIRKVKERDSTILFGYRNRIPTNIFNFFWVETNVTANMGILWPIIIFLDADSTEGVNSREFVSTKFKKDLAQDYITMYKPVFDKYCYDSLVYTSSALRAFIILKIKVELTIKLKKIPSIKDVLLELQKLYNGDMYDKIAGQLMFYYVYYIGPGSTHSNEELEFCYKEGFRTVKIPFIKEAFQKKMTLTRGAEAFNFSMIDTTGKINKLSDFRGKVVLVDCWYTGCTGCAIFYRHFKDSIEPALRDSSDFVILSVNLDPSKEQWLKSIYKNIYTDKYHVNLYSGAKNYDPDFLKYYSIHSAPFTLLIDKNGKIIIWNLGGFTESYDDVKQIIIKALRS